jgi:hypothetical protein
MLAPFALLALVCCAEAALFFHTANTPLKFWRYNQQGARGSASSPHVITCRAPDGSTNLLLTLPNTFIDGRLFMACAARRLLLPALIASVIVTLRRRRATAPRRARATATCTAFSRAPRRASRSSACVTPPRSRAKFRTTSRRRIRWGGARAAAGLTGRRAQVFSWEHQPETITVPRPCSHARALSAERPTATQWAFSDAAQSANGTLISVCFWVTVAAQSAGPQLTRTRRRSCPSRTHRARAACATLSKPAASCALGACTVCVCVTGRRRPGSWTEQGGYEWPLGDGSKFYIGVAAHDYVNEQLCAFLESLPSWFT